MRRIAHRGNTQGPTPDENNPDYILEALNNGFDAEIDVWYIDGQFWLGHDEPQYRTFLPFLQDSRVWCHAKSLECLIELLSPLRGVHCFWHQDDDYTLTSKGYIWTYPGKPVCPQSVLVIEDAREYNGPICHGLCSDYFIK